MAKVAKQATGLDPTGTWSLHLRNERLSDFNVATTRVSRKSFTFLKAFAFSLSFMSIWESVLLTIANAFQNGGPQSLSLGMLVALAGALAQSASIAEISSIYASPGAQYQWTYRLAPERFKRLLTYLQGWITWFSWISLLATTINVTATMLQGLIAFTVPSYVPQRWHITVIIYVIVVGEGLVNTFAFRTIPWANVLGSCLHVLLFVVYATIFLIAAPKRKASFIFLNHTTSRGWKDEAISCQIGILVATTGFIGFESVAHLSDETVGSRSAIPRIMIWTNVINGALAFVMVVIALFTLGPLEDIFKSMFPILEICQHATGSRAAATAMVGALFLLRISMTLSGMTSVSRLTLSWARDGGIPRYFSRIDQERDLPVRAVWLPVALVMLLAILDIVSTTAFSAFLALSSLALYTSYLIVISCMLHARCQTKELIYGEWSLGRLGLPINVFALVFTAWGSVFYTFPQRMPVTVANMNYALPIFASVVLLAFGLWIGHARYYWAGIE